MATTSSSIRRARRCAWTMGSPPLRGKPCRVNALHQLGFEDEVDGFLRWVRAAHDRHPEHFQVMYTIDAEDRLPEFVLNDLEGYRGSRPVRIGNAAVEQVQLDIYGELVQTAYTAWQSRK